MLVLPVHLVYSQEQKLYDPEIDAMAQIREAVSKANKENKHVLVQVGGNWCSWCIRLHNYVKSNQELDSIVSAGYVPVKINYSKENKNPDALEYLEYPQRFGFPVLVILDENGNRLHTQDSGLLESGQGYDYNKVKRFLLSWNRQAVTPKTNE